MALDPADHVPPVLSAGPPLRWVSLYLRGLGVALALCSGIAALALLLLPLLLVLLMVLFDTVTRGVLVLIGSWLDWLRGALPGGSAGLPPFQAIAFHPLRVALGSLMRSLPCLGGLMLVSPRRGAGGWWCIVLFWVLAGSLGGPTVAAILLPGGIAAMLLALLRPGRARR